MIDFSIPSETQLLVHSVRQFIDKELKPLEKEVEETQILRPEVAKALRAKSRELGFYGMFMPEDAGGGGLDTVAMCLVEEQFGWTKDVLVRRAFGVIPAALVSCTGAQRDKYLYPAVRGDINVGFALTEPGAGSDAAGIRTKARRDGDGWVLNGSKHFISDADVAEAFLVTAVTDPSAGAKGISAFLVDRGTPGFEIGKIQYMMGLRGTNHCELFFADCRIADGQMLGAPGQGLHHVFSSLNAIRLAMIGARSVGMASKLLEMGIAYANQREQFGRKIGEYQLIQQMLADSATEIYATRMMMLNAAWEVDQGRAPREKISMIKIFASEMLGRVADRTLQVFGGMGYCCDMPVERMYRDARVYRIFDGTSEIHRLVVAGSLLKNGMLTL